MISVTWDMPPYMPKIRPNQTVLQILFEPVYANTTRVRLFHTGFSEGEPGKGGMIILIKLGPQFYLAIVIGRTLRN